MQRLLIIHTPDADLKEIAEGIKEGAESQGFRVDIKNTKDIGNGVSFYPYDQILAGSPTKGIFRGEIDQSLNKFLSESKRTVGKDAVAYVKPRFFATNKALKKVMSALEAQGCIVKNFKAIKDHQSAVEFGKNIKI
ncbi:MAG: DNA-binding response regulator [Halanaerobium sp.]